MRSISVAVTTVLAFVSPRASSQDEFPLPRVVPLSALPHGAVARYGTRAFCHAGPVGCVAYFPDGKRLISVGFDKTLRVWNSATGDELARVADIVPYAAGCVTFASDPRFVIVSDAANAFCRFDLQELKPVFRATGPADLFAHSRDGSRVASFGPTSPSLHILDATTDGHLLRSIPLTVGVARCAAFSPDGSRISYGGQKKKKGHGKYDGTIVVQSLVDDDDRVEFPTPDVLLISTTFSPDGSRVVTAGSDGCLYSVDVSTKKLLEKKLILKSPAIALRYSPDGKTIAIGSNDGTLALVDASTFAVVQVVKAHSAGIRSIDYSRDGTRIATGSFESAIEQWKSDTLEELVHREGHEKAASSVVALGDGLVATSGYDGNVILWHDGAVEKCTNTTPNFVFQLAYAPATRMLASVGQDNAVSLWNDAGRGELRRVACGDAAIFAAAFSHDGARLAIACSDGWARVLQVADGTELLRVKHTANFVTGVAWSRTDDELWTADSIVHVWSAKDGSLLRTIDAPKAPIQALRLSPDGKTIAVAAADTKVHVYDAATGAEVLAFKAAEDRVKDVAYSPDGSMLATCGESELPVRLWSVSDGSEIASFAGHEGPTMGLCFSADGARLFTASADGTALEWDVTASIK